MIVIITVTMVVISNTPNKLWIIEAAASSPNHCQRVYILRALPRQPLTSRPEANFLLPHPMQHPLPAILTSPPPPATRSHLATTAFLLSTHIPHYHRPHISPCTLISLATLADYGSCTSVIRHILLLGFLGLVWKSRRFGCFEMLSSKCTARGGRILLEAQTRIRHWRRLWAPAPDRRWKRVNFSEVLCCWSFCSYSQVYKHRVAGGFVRRLKLCIICIFLVTFTAFSLKSVVSHSS